MFCGGHVNRAHTKQLKELAAVQAFSTAFKMSHKKNFPEVENVKCCGLSKSSLHQARINFFCVLLQAEASPSKRYFNSWAITTVKMNMNVKMATVNFMTSQCVVVVIAHQMSLYLVKVRNITELFIMSHNMSTKIT